MAETINKQEQPKKEVETSETIPPPVVVKRGPWRLIFFAILVFAVVTSLTVAVVFFAGTREVDQHFEAGNKSYDLAFNELEAALQALAKVKISSDDLAGLEDEAEDILKRIPKAEKRLDRAKGHFDKMGDTAFSGWERQTAAHAHRSVVQAEKGVKELEFKIGQLHETALILSRVRDSSEKFNDAFARTNVAINAGNEDKFDEGKAEAEAATKLFSLAQTLLTEANEMLFDADMSDASAKVARAKRWSEGTGQMMQAGLDEKLDDYNQLAQKNNVLSDQMAEIARDSVLSDPDKWVRQALDKQNERIQRAFGRADESREQALDLWEQNT